jgi:hypothetical protein
MRKVAILCAARNSIYHQMPDVEVYDQQRDARTFQGGMPVIAHPPCRSWSAFCRHQAKPEPGEQELALWCIEQVQQWGGVLEQPAHSRLFDHLPAAGRIVKLDQFWFGLPMKKGTWLWMVGCPVPQLPLRLHDGRSDRAMWNTKSKHQRAATPRLFAEWLLELARSTDVVGQNAEP